MAVVTGVLRTSYAYSLMTKTEQPSSFRRWSNFCSLRCLFASDVKGESLVDRCGANLYVQ